MPFTIPSTGPDLRIALLAKAGAAILLPAVLALSLGGCGSGKAEKSKPVPVVGVMVARAEPVPLTTELAGRTEASEIAEVRP